MALYHRLGLGAFAEAFGQTRGVGGSFTLRAVELGHAIPVAEIDYSLSLFREAIGRYEASHGIPPERSKRQMPFFRQGTRMLVGPELGMYVVRLGDSPESAPYGGDPAEPSLLLELDYSELGEHCLLENLALERREMAREPNILALERALEDEYEKFFFNEEHTGFKADSKLFSLLRTACSRMAPAGTGGEWLLSATGFTEDADYRYVGKDLIPSLDLALPLACLVRVYLPEREKHPLLFGTLNGFLKSKGLPAERLLGLD